ncbi:MAG: hypothetical protein ACYC3I_26550 [Gemmataceae bacterium]
MTLAQRRDPEARWQHIRMVMAQNAYFLARRGSIVAKKTSGGQRWVLRFSAPNSQGRFVHRSICLGSDDATELLQRARELLQRYRTLADNLGGIRMFARLGAKAADILVRPDRHRGAGRSKEPAPGGM